MYKEEPRNPVLGAATAICYYFVQMHTDVVPHFSFWIAMKTHCSVGCLATVSKGGFVHFIWPSLKGKSTDLLSIIICKIILTSTVKGTI